MKSLSNHSAFADHSSGIPPKLKPFKALTQKLSSSAWKGILGLTVIVSVLGVATSAQAFMRLGAFGPGVAQVQSALGIPADGLFGLQTHFAVKEFQRRACIQVDGVVGPDTWRALFGGSVPSSTAYTDPAPVRSVGIPAGGTPVGTSIPNNILEPGIKPPSTVLPPAVTGPYVVVVPGTDGQRLSSIRQIVPNAVIDGAHPGGFINAGGYPNWDSAREVAGRLRGFGFDARVDYFDHYHPANSRPDGSSGYRPCVGRQC
jgi:peptidoglycan hydrolase-like protein with peptidoglycan-binding domain